MLDDVIYGVLCVWVCECVYNSWSGSFSFIFSFLKDSALCAFVANSCDNVLLTYGQYDLGDEFHTLQCAASSTTCSESVHYVILWWSVLVCPKCLQPPVLSTTQCFNLLLRHQHPLPNKGLTCQELWPLNLQCLQHSSFILSSLANVLVTKFTSRRGKIFYTSRICPARLRGSWCPCSTSAGRQVAATLWSALIQMKSCLFFTSLWLRAQFTFCLICRCSCHQNEMIS